MMKVWNRHGEEIVSNEGQNNLLKNLYGNILGRSVLKVLTLPFITHLGGAVMNSSLSKKSISSFVEKNNIDMSQYEKKEYKSYNDFFTRKIIEGQRDIDDKAEHLISPADSKVTYYPIDENTHLLIKDSLYTISELLEDEKLAEKYKGGVCLICRLCVDDYHRYHYIDNGKTQCYKYIKGKFHTVNPIANDYYPIYKQNSRAYSLLSTENFGEVIYMEVGAMMVGKIVNYPKQHFVKGEEKGYFEFGGSTIVLLFEKNKVAIDQDIINNSLNHDETKVHLGEKIGVKFDKSMIE